MFNTAISQANKRLLGGSYFDNYEIEYRNHKLFVQGDQICNFTNMSTIEKLSKEWFDIVGFIGFVFAFNAKAKEPTLINFKKYLKRYHVLDRFRPYLRYFQIRRNKRHRRNYKMATFN